jgi:subtilisin family serine protease
MTRRFLAAIAVAALLVSAAVPSAVAQGPSGRFQRVDIGNRIDTGLVPRLLNNARPITVMLQFAGDPVAVRQAKAGRVLSKAERASIRGSLKRTQDVTLAAVRRAGGRIVGQLQDAYNGVQVVVKASKVAQLAALPGVIAVHGVRTFTRDNTVGVPFIGAPQVWTDTGFTGSGVIIADIDTGLDYYHANFGGSGNPADFAFGAAHSTTAPGLNADGVTVAFPSAKVPKGFDFVGDDYNADPASPTFQPVPHPDPNPLDCASDLGGGHGSHTAGTAAGFGVLSDGTTFHGPYNSGIYAANTFSVGPGVAPDATIYAYRVFGCAGASDVVDLAINRAVADGANVINMSLGSDFGRQDDPTTVAANNAAAAGVIVVAASGNAGPGGYITSSPASGDRVISAAAIDAEFATFPSAVIGSVTGINANAGPLPVTGKIHVLRNSAGGLALGCDDADYATVVAGDITVSVRGVCARVDRATKSQAHGAVAAIMVNNGTGLPPFEGDIPGVTIPFIGTNNAAATVSALEAADGTTVTITAGAPIANTGFKRIATFSSAGPRNGDSAPKPEVTAPGVSILSTAVGTGTGGIRMSGTSMATPMTTGSAALVRQAHPTWTVDQVKAALMNTADATTGSILGYNVRTAGAGVVQAQRAVSTVALATTADHLDSLAFNYDGLSAAWTETHSFTLSNTSGSPITYDVAASFVGSSLGAAASVSPTNVTVAGGDSATVSLTLSLTAAAVAALPAADIFAGGSGPGGVFTVRGAVVATPSTTGAGIFPLRVPFLAVPRGLSSVAAGPRSAYVNHGDILTATSQITNAGIHAGDADVYAWGLSSGRAGSGTNDVRAIGVQSLPGAVLGAANTDRSLIFAVNTWNQWSTPSSNEFDIGIDNNGDGNLDFFVVGVDLGAVLAGAFNGQVASFTFDAAGNLIDAFLADAPVNSSVSELPVIASEIGVTAAHPSFRYIAAGFSVENGSADFVPGVASYDAFRSAASNGDFISLAPGASSTLTLNVDRQQLGAPSPHVVSPLGWMVVTLDDGAGAAQADLIDIGKVNPNK